MIELTSVNMNLKRCEAFCRSIIQQSPDRSFCLWYIRKKKRKVHIFSDGKQKTKMFRFRHENNQIWEDGVSNCLTLSPFLFLSWTDSHHSDAFKEALTFSEQICLMWNFCPWLKWVLKQWSADLKQVWTDVFWTCVTDAASEIRSWVDQKCVTHLQKVYRHWSLSSWI